MTTQSGATWINSSGNAPVQRYPGRLAVAVVVCAIATVIGACANVGEQVRKVTYPPGFKYVSQSEVRATMHDLMAHLRELDHSLAPPIQQAAVIDALGKLEVGAQTLDPGPEGSTHSYLYEQLTQFLDRVRHSKMAASMVPPRYDPALKIVDECARCHVINR